MAFEVFSTWWPNGGVHRISLYDGCSRFYRILKVSNFISVNFQTQVSIWFLISMKFRTRIISKKSLLKYVPHAPSRLRCLRTLMPYAPSCLRALRALRTCFIYAPCAPFSRALFVRLKIFLGWIFSAAETFHFPKTIKGTTNRAVFMRFKKHWYFLSGEIC